MFHWWRLSWRRMRMGSLNSNLGKLNNDVILEGKYLAIWEGE